MTSLENIASSYIFKRKVPAAREFLGSSEPIIDNLIIFLKSNICEFILRSKKSGVLFDHERFINQVVISHFITHIPVLEYRNFIETGQNLVEA